MESLKELYKIGNGPSSSHTMGPKKAAERFAERCHDADAYRVTLYGSLAATGKGHLTDTAILSVLEPLAPTEIVWKPEVVLPFHPNGMLFEGLKAGNVTDSWTIYSIGGGALANETSRLETPHSIYPLTTVSEIKAWCSHEGKTYWEYVTDCEGPEIWDYLDEIWTVMCETIQRGLNNDGVLPGGLKVARKASTYWIKSKSYTDSLKSRAQIYAYALATSEENASGGTVVTAPTCGSCGVVPAVLYHLANSRNFLRIRILRALATAGLFGNVAKTNASISGAEVGCQGEVGVACAMAAAAACQLFGGTPAQIEYAAEMGLEHHLGLTCDPVCGLVQVPCIERNAIAAARAFDANAYATLSDGSHMVSFDKVVEVMNETGHNLPSLYRIDRRSRQALQRQKITRTGSPRQEPAVFAGRDSHGSASAARRHRMKIRQAARRPPPHRPRIRASAQRSGLRHHRAATPTSRPAHPLHSSHSFSAVPVCQLSAWQVFAGPVSSNSAKHASLQRTGFSAIRSNSVSGHLRLRRNTRFGAANASDR